jgi:hypothetical protein
VKAEGAKGRRSSLRIELSVGAGLWIPSNTLKPRSIPCIGFGNCTIDSGLVSATRWSWKKTPEAVTEHHLAGMTPSFVTEAPEWVCSSEWFCSDIDRLFNLNSKP